MCDYHHLLEQALDNKYISEDELYTESARNAISYSFSRQNGINKSTVKEFNRLQSMLDSITISNKMEIVVLQEELQKDINHSNTIIKKLVFSNSIIIMLFLFFYFRPKKS